LIDDITKIIKGQVPVILFGQKRTWALLTELVTAAGWLDVDGTWQINNLRISL
jgi:hypothetical protein